jgi:AraC-like DNA-binding protein
MVQSAQWVRVYRLASPYSGEIVHARYLRHRFARHMHEHLVIGLVETGVQQYSYRGCVHTTPAKQIFFVDGGEAHTGEPATSDGYLYRTLCFSPRVFTDLTREVTGHADPPHFRHPVVADRHLYVRLMGLHRAVAVATPVMELESRVFAVVQHLARAHLERRRPVPRAGKDLCVARRVREFLDAHYAEDVSLARLGALTSRNAFHVARVFSRIYGLPPHAYMESRRVQRARELLRAGATVVDTALSVGYSDQSHFTHRFRRHTGITPGRYRTASLEAESTSRG